MDETKRELEYTTEDWPGYFGTYTLLADFGKDGYGLLDEDIKLLEACGYTMTHVPKF